jgi:hypothetical protein
MNLFAEELNPLHVIIYLGVTFMVCATIVISIALIKGHTLDLGLDEKANKTEIKK